MTKRRVTVSGPLTVRLAGPGDVDVVQSILTEACRWLASLGVREQWPADGFPLEQTAGFIAEGRMFVGELEGEPVATIAVDRRPDLDFWGGHPEPEPAWYVHRLAVRRRFARQGIGAALLDWAGAYAARHGGRVLRLDVNNANPALHRYYVGLGFTHLCTVHLDDGAGSGYLFERPVRVVGALHGGPA